MAADTTPQHSSRVLHEQNRHVPPHDYDAERATLGAILLDGDALQDVSELLSVDDFYRKAHAVILNQLLTFSAAV